MKCSICYNQIHTDYGHNAQPINNGTCCDMCNQTQVLPERIRQYLNYDETKDMLDGVYHLRNKEKK